MAKNNDFHHYYEFYSDVITEAHCVMVDVPKYPRLMQYIAKIPQDCIYEEPGEDYGREKNPHVTILYGLTEKTEKQVKNLLTKVPKKLVAQLGAVSKFHGEKFDVLKIDARSPQLTRLNAILRKNFENTNEFPNYIPHVTLAYVKKGTCEEFVGDTLFSGVKVLFDAFLYSNGNRAENHHVAMREYNEAPADGYAGGAMLAGARASEPQTSNRLNDYPPVAYSQEGNVVVGGFPYNTITKDDLAGTNFSSDEMLAGFRTEMAQMKFPDKAKAKPIVVKNLQKNPRYYSDLDKYLKSDQ